MVLQELQMNGNKKITAQSISYVYGALVKLVDKASAGTNV